ncbi:E3 ubiquitin-protein ligase RBBP6-like [Astatotilapia calliptera]|uniref:E3 ubiquitin-protein ligase RBBP6-like n=1 Tax=Astatotilapia calliptera TaxID=8154 RepID=UPI000E418A35|nr:E3 ubiquitin-protein ligase RBBP6-like [Astatotilapia calliptera]
MPSLSSDGSFDVSSDSSVSTTSSDEDSKKRKKKGRAKEHKKSKKHDQKPRTRELGVTDDGLRGKLHVTLSSRSG